MYLTFKSAAVSFAFGTVSFFLADEDRTIRVDVGQEILAKLADSPLGSKADYVRRLGEHRGEFALIAAAKYARGDYRQEVRVLVIDIHTSDLF